MKRGLFLFLFVSFFTIGYAQKTVQEEAKENFPALTDSFTEGQKDFANIFMEYMEYVSVSAIDSIKNEGRYMQALDKIDSLQVKWEALTGSPLPWRVYLSKVEIQMSLEEWKDAIATVEECFIIHKDDIPDWGVSMLYEDLGRGYLNLKEYREAIRSYENVINYYIDLDELDSLGDIYCSIAYCYKRLGKYNLANSFYKKGLDKYLNYFGTTSPVLLKSNFHVQDSYKQTNLNLFALHLYDMAVLQHEYGNRSASKEYLIMSAHCGNEDARREYLRRYGR